MKQKVIDMRKELKIDALKKLKAFVKTNQFNKGNINGLCLAILRMYSKLEIITRSQLNYLQLIIDNDSYNYNNQWESYYWKPGLKAPRIRWINKKLKELE